MRKKLWFGKMPHWCSSVFNALLLQGSPFLKFCSFFRITFLYIHFQQRVQETGGRIRTGEERKGKAREGGEAAGGGLQTARESAYYVVPPS